MHNLTRRYGVRQRIAFCGLLLLSGSSQAAFLEESALLSPHLDYRTIETEHFRITFEEKLAGVAKLSAGHFEQAFDLLSFDLKWKPSYKVSVILVDNTDLSNGFAAAVLRLGIVLFVTPPESWFSTDHYEDWLRLVIYHELVHVLNQDVTTGIWQPLRFIFGDAVVPNSLWPSWMSEGLAVYFETRYTKAGRGKSTLYSMILRSACQEGALNREDWITLDKINGPNPYYPGGETRYLFGYLLMRELVSQYGENILGDLSYESGGRIPFFINGNLENITEKKQGKAADWYAVWDSFVKKKCDDAKKEIETIQKLPLSNTRLWTTNHFETLGVALSPNRAWIATIDEGVDRRSGITLWDRGSGQEVFRVEKLYGSGLAFSPDSKKLFFSQMTRTSQYTFFSDLAFLDLQKRKIETITHGLRARDPDLRSDGKKLVFTLTEDQTTGLAMADWNGERLENIERIYWPTQFSRVSNPKWIGQEIVFSVKTHGELGEDILKYDLSARKVTVLIRDGSRNRYPTQGAGKSIFFISDRTGVDNLFAFEAGKTTMRSNLISGVRMPVMDGAGDGRSVFGSLFTIRGYQLAELELLHTQETTMSPDMKNPGLLPKENNILQPKQLQAEITRYQPWKSLLPRAWSPFVFYSKSRTYLGGQIIGFDQLDIHNYQWSGGWDSDLKKGDLKAFYSYRGFGPTLGLGYGHFTDGIRLAASGAILRHDRTKMFFAELSFPWRWTRAVLTPSVLLQLEKTRTFRGKESDRALQDSTYKEIQGQIVFSNPESTRIGVAPDRGFKSEATTRYYAPPESNQKTFLGHDHFFQPLGRTVLSPKLALAWSNRRIEDSRSSVLMSSFSQASFSEIYQSNSIDRMTLKGYPTESFNVRSALFGGMDYMIPLVDLYRGWGTNPLFFKNCYAKLFSEIAFRDAFHSFDDFFPSAGGAIRYRLDAFINIGLVLSAEFHQGLNHGKNGQSEFYFILGLPSVPL